MAYIIIIYFAGDVHLHEHLYALPSTSQETAAPKPNEADVSLQEVQHSVSPVIIQSTTVPAKLEIEADVSLQERQHPVSPSTVQSTTVTAVHSVEGQFGYKYLTYFSADVSLQERQHPVSPSTVQSTTVTAVHSVEADVSLQERHPFSASTVQTVQSTTVSAKHSIEGLSRSRKPLMDITHRYNVAGTSKFSEEHISAEQHVTDKLSDPVTGKESTNAPLAHTSKRLTTKDTSSVREFNSKTRRFIKQTKQIAAESLGQTAAERLQSAHEHASLDILQDFEKLNKKAKAFLLMQLRLARKNKMARRFTFQDKLFALALMKQSPKGYKLLENIFALPTKRTLARVYTVQVAGHDLFIFHDPPHLLKSIRNNFLDKDIVYNGKIASWKDILYVYDTDMQGGHTRALPRLTADHVDPKKIKKMKVKMAAQVLSARTAAMLKFTDSVHKRVNSPQETMETTAEVVLFFDELFDSVNGSPGQGKGKLRCAVKETSSHKDFWLNAIRTLQSMTFLDRNSKLAIRNGQPRHVRVPCLEGWITTLKSFLGLSKILFSTYKVKYFYPRFVNQDPIENFFGRIRAINYRNVNPDANTFIYSFKSIVLSNILTPQSTSMNCEDDDGETLINLSNLFFTTSPQDEKENWPRNVNTPSSSSVTLFRQDKMNYREVVTERMNVQTSAYTAGYICRKITKKANCNECAKSYTTEEKQGIHEYIKHREYKRLKNANLKYPNSRMVCLYRECAQIIHNYLNAACHSNDIKKKIIAIIKSRCELSWLGCKSHKILIKKYFMTLVIRLQVHNWCNIINRILNGKIEEKYILKMHTLHVTAYKKYKAHRLRQKATKD
ncbi:uncharacterized protein LOC134659477 [Cydia amplana]|uniref:uncharacterized protein LOC134659477 n=1 Tax=Cydia amplana TaxID=1869771 RepID=UPI002FE51257